MHPVNSNQQQEPNLNQQQEPNVNQHQEQNSNQYNEHHYIKDHPSAKKTIMRELLEYQDDDSLLFTADIENDDLFSLRITLSPPENTPYEEGIFFLSVIIPAQYPYSRPSVKFETKIYHPNVDDEGRISLKSLIDGWKSSYNIKKVIEIIIDLMKNPDPEYFLVPSIADQYYNDYDTFEKTAREWTRMYAV